MSDLLARWHAAWQALGAVSAGDPLGRRVLARYAEPHRRYHTLRHLEECLAHLDTLRPIAERPAEVELALWFHDAVYDTRRDDNEERSAEWARKSARAGGLSADAAGRIHTLVMATRHDAPAVGRDAAVLVDADLAILGSDPARFDEYERQIRDEYAWVPEPIYRCERGKVLQAFLDRPSLYRTEPFRAAYEAQARENLARSLARLRPDGR